MDAVNDGVTDSALPNLKGAEIVGLLSGRELYAQILEDSAMLISLVTESAMTAAESDVRLSEAFENNEPFKLLSLNTDYMTTGEGGSDSSVSSRGGRNTTNKDSVDPVLASIEGKRRIQITAQFEVPLADVGVHARPCRSQAPL